MTFEVDYDYPSKSQLRRIRTWEATEGYDALMDYAHSIWWAPSWGWREFGRRPAEVSDWSHKKGQRYYDISTGGWSGNEDIIGALERNWMFMAVCFYRHRKGGHYLFLVPPTFKAGSPELKRVREHA